MSWWQRSQACDCMKYLAGIFLPSRGCTELGKTLPFGPSPSPSMVSAGILGFTTRYAFLQATFRTHHEPDATAVMTKARTAKLMAAPANPWPNHLRRAIH